MKWEAHRNGDNLTAIELQYTDDDTGFDVASFRAAIQEAIEVAESKVDAEVAEKREEASEA